MFSRPLCCTAEEINCGPTSSSQKRGRGDVNSRFWDDEVGPLLNKVYVPPFVGKNAKRGLGGQPKPAILGCAGKLSYNCFFPALTRAFRDSFEDSFFPNFLRQDPPGQGDCKLCRSPKHSRNRHFPKEFCIWCGIKTALDDTSDETFCVFSVFLCVGRAFDATSRCTPKLKNGTPLVVVVGPSLMKVQDSSTKSPAK